MLRQSLIYFVLSILIVVFAQQMHLLVVYIDLLYTYANIQLAPVFSNSDSGILIRKVFSLVMIPAAIAGIPALLYRLIKGHRMPYFIEITWILWLVIVLSKVLIR